MIELDKGLKQIILYCKGHFYTTDIINDLKILIGKRLGIESSDIVLRDIYRILLEIIKQCSVVYINNNLVYELLLNDLFDDALGITINDVIQKLVSIIDLMPVRNNKHELMIDLGGPDYTWLPKYESVRLKIMERG